MFYVEKPLGYFYVAERRASRHARGDIPVAEVKAWQNAEMLG